MNSENECNPLLFNDEESENSFLIKEDLKIDDNIDKKAEIATENSLKKKKMVKIIKWMIMLIKMMKIIK